MQKVDQLAVLVDEDSPMLSETEGTPLFKEDGTKSEYLEKKIERLLKTAEQTVQTEGICKLFKEKDLLATQQCSCSIARMRRAIISEAFIQSMRRS